ncbi:MAG TPA: type II toxin-antitoxin system ParD family antitoxin [Longimicrobium sp.]|jgi:antitoxin ParD1/3/4|nr:type II toxin-antitoxin system ParD family antitoxin [Longimicrobium sp.]
MPISLSPNLERLIEEKVESGEYDSAEDVVSDAMRLLNERSEEDAAKLAALRADIDVAIGEIERGELTPGPVAVERARAEYRRLTGRAS